MNDFFVNPENNFFIGILSGLGVALILYVLGKLIKLLKKFLVNFRRIHVSSKSKILYIYDSFEEAEDQMYKDAKNSKKILIYACRDVMFTEATNKMYELLKKDDCDIRLLLADPDSEAIKKRAGEIGLPMPSALAPVKASIAVVKGLQDEYSSIKLETYDDILRIRYYIFDESVFLGFGLKNKRSIQTQVYRIGSESIIYQCLVDQFEDLWEKYGNSIL